jgi:hypothetical protein
MRCLPSSLLGAPSSRRGPGVGLLACVSLVAALIWLRRLRTSQPA